MQKKNLFILFLVIVLVGVFVYPRVMAGTATAVELSDVSANPSKFIGKLTIAGNAGPVFADDGVFQLVDQKGCCQIYLLVPFTAAQQKELEISALYTGTLPTEGESIQTTGTLKREGANYVFDVEKVSRDGKVIISKK